MASKNEVRSFLRDFKYKLDFVGDVLYRDDRGKNIETLLLLEFRSHDRKRILKELDIEDYCEGPTKDTLHHGPDMWLFGKIVKGYEIYIKITIGAYGSKVVCVSFHVAVEPLVYPFKATS